MIEKEKVYIVTCGSYSDYRIVEVFSKEEKAQALIDEINDSECDIEEYEVDRNKKWWWHIAVEMDKDGDVIHTERNQGEIYSGHDGYMCGTTNALFSVQTGDEDLAIKVAGERRRFILANDAWGNENFIRNMKRGDIK